MKIEDLSLKEDFSQQPPEYPTPYGGSGGYAPLQVFQTPKRGIQEVSRDLKSMQGESGGKEVVGDFKSQQCDQFQFCLINLVVCLPMTALLRCKATTIIGMQIK